jgi:hypothetical protein
MEGSERVADRRQGSRFAVDLGELKLPDEIEKGIELEIQKVVLRSLADIDFRGDLRIDRFPPGVYGMILNVPYPEFPGGIDTSPRGIDTSP